MNAADYFRRPLGLVLTGAGALGGWQATALKKLEESSLVFDHVLGFSAGALTGAYYIQGLLSEALKRWQDINGSVLRFHPKLSPLSLFSDRPVWEAAACARDEAAAKSRARCRLTVVSARLARDRAVYAEFGPGGRDYWDQPLAGHLVASCAIPLVFPPVRLRLRGVEEELLDGAVPCAEPMSFKSLRACRDIIILEVVRGEEFERATINPLRWFDQRGRSALKLLVKQGICSLREGPMPPRIFRLTPSHILRHNTLAFHARVAIMKSLALGAKDAGLFLLRPQDYLSS